MTSKNRGKEKSKCSWTLSSREKQRNCDEALKKGSPITDPRKISQIISVSKREFNTWMAERVYCRYEQRAR